jgi:hypothetical protein
MLCVFHPSRLLTLTHLVPPVPSLPRTQVEPWTRGERCCVCLSPKPFAHSHTPCAASAVAASNAAAAAAASGDHGTRAPPSLPTPNNGGERRQ